MANEAAHVPSLTVLLSPSVRSPHVLTGSAERPSSCTKRRSARRIAYERYRDDRNSATELRRREPEPVLCSIELVAAASRVVCLERTRKAENRHSGRQRTASGIFKTQSGRQSKARCASVPKGPPSKHVSSEARKGPKAAYDSYRGQSYRRTNSLFRKRLYGPEYEQTLWRTSLKRTFPDKKLSRAQVAVQLERLYQSAE